MNVKGMAYVLHGMMVNWSCITWDECKLEAVLHGMDVKRKT